jgi:branched-chain amino acid transport system ATP-binding protein
MRPWNPLVARMLTVEGIAVAYDGLPALHDVTFSVEQGETVALVGSNGAGKTTTLRAISGLVHPVRGRIRFEGHDLTREPAHHIVRFGIAHVPEGRHLFARQTILENLLLGAYGRKGAAGERERREELLERVFKLFPVLRERQRERAGTLSGGQQQMLAIGRGLMSQPRLLMLDEPSLGLSPRLVDAVFEIVREIKAQGMTVLLVEQNVREALEVADRGFVLQTGRVVASGTARDLLESDLVRKAYLGL